MSDFDLSRSVVARVRDAVDIVAVIGEVVTLRKAGRNYMGLCPFHGEKTPSFAVSREKGTYYCFGCKRGGDAIDFLMEHDRLSFADAVERLASRFGVELPAASPEARRRRTEQDSLQQVMDAAQAFFVRHLSEDRPRAFLERRGLTLEVASAFGLGYALGEWRALYDELRKRFPERALVAAGLVVEGENGRLWDRFRDRVTIPIRSARGSLIAFGGRVVGDEQPKYLNSPESVLFSKSTVLYCADRAAPAFAKTNRAVVVEGYFDCIALQQAGVQETVATLGTALSEHHARDLARKVTRVVVCYDGDAAGRAAAAAAVRTLVAADVDAYVALLPDGLDPDDLVRRSGPAAIAELLDNALDTKDFLISQLGSTQEERRTRLQSALEVADACPDPVKRHVLRDALALSAGVRIEQLVAQAAPRVLAGDVVDASQFPAGELTLLRLLLIDLPVERQKHLASLVSLDVFTHPGTRALAEAVISALRTEKSCLFEDILTTLEDREARRAAAAVEHAAPVTPDSRQTDVIRSVLEKQLRADLIATQTDLENAVRKNDPTEIRRHTERTASLLKTLASLKDFEALLAAHSGSGKRRAGDSGQTDR